MRKLMVALLVVVMLVTSGCAGRRHFGQEQPRYDPPAARELDRGFAEELRNGRPMPHAKEALAGEVSLEAAMLPLGGTSAEYGAWQTYLGKNSTDIRVGSRPHYLQVKPVVMQRDEGRVCADLVGSYPDLEYPRICPSGDGLFVLVYPVSSLDEVLASNPDQARLAVALMASYFFAAHMRVSLQGGPHGGGLPWPPPSKNFDSCVAGVGLRALYPSDADIAETDITAAARMLQDALNSYDAELISPARVFSGWRFGNLGQCGN